jgi:uncharacterized membrane protein YfcA
MRVERARGKPAIQFRHPSGSSVLLETLGILWLGAFLGGIASGGAGFGFAVVASSIWLHDLTPLQSTFLVVGSGTVLQTSLIWPMRRNIEIRRLWPFLAGGAIGIPIGVNLLARIDANTTKLALGSFLIAFGAYAILAPRLPRIGWGGRYLDAVIGLIGGIMGGIGGYSGIAPTIWTQLRHWSKDVSRAIYQPFILFAHIGTLFLIGVVAFDETAAILLIASLPALLAGAFVGWTIYGRLDEKRFRQAIALLLVISGAALVF